MCRGLIQWWQSRTVSAVPVAGWTSSAGEGSTASAGPFSQWSPCDCPTSGSGRWWCPTIWNLNDSTAVTVLFMMVKWGESMGFSPEVHDPLHCFEHVQLQVVKTAPDSQLHNLLSADSSLYWMRPISVVSSANFRSLIEGSLDVQSFV